jgi:WD40 repeat protein
LKVFKGHSGGVLSAYFYNNDKQIISAGDDGKIILWDIQTQTSVGEFKGNYKEISISSDGNKIA